MAYEKTLINGVTKSEFKGNYYYTFNSYISIVANVNSDTYVIFNRDKSRTVKFDDITDKLGASDIVEYVDALATAGYFKDNANVAGGGGGVPEAPNDGTQYGRQNESWTPILSSGQVNSVVGGVDIAIDNTDPINPIVNYTNKSAITVLVRQVSDFGTIVGNKVIDIDPFKVYVIDGIIDMGSVSLEIPAGGISLSGYTFDVSQLVSSADNYTMFTSPVGGSGNQLMINIGITTSGLNSRVNNLVSATGFDAIEIIRVNYNNCSSRGEITNYRQGFETGTGYFGGTPELTLSGSWVGGYFIESSIARALQDGNYFLFKAGAGFSMNSRFRSNQNVDLKSNIGFFDFSSANFPNPNTVQLDGAIISRNFTFNVDDLTITPNMLASNLSAKFTGNVGIKNTFVGGRKTVTTEAETVIGVAGQFYDILGTYTASELSHFDAPSNGRLRSLGVNPVEFRVETSFTIEGTRDRDISVRARVWDDSQGVFIDYPKQTRPVNNFTGGRDVAFFTLIVNVEMQINDYILFQVANETDASNVTMETDSFYVVEER